MEDISEMYDIVQSRVKTHPRATIKYLLQTHKCSLYGSSEMKL